MKRLLAIVPAAALLTSCTALDVVGPRANGEIMALAKQASADESSLVDAPAAHDLRAAHADQLVAEAQRLCGTDPDGATPPTCRVTYGDADLPAGAVDVGALVDQVRASAVDAADKVPDDSVDLVVSQAVDTVALAPVNLDGLNVSDAPAADLDAAREALRREYVLEYGLGMATAWGDEAVDERVDELRGASDKRREALAAALEPTGEVPQPLPGYEFADGSAPYDADSAAAFIERLHADTVAELRRAAGDATGSQWRDAAIGLSAHAQRV
ncbi:hypothetical protein G7Y29_06700 [Corynebacterium qintianiae]|uniref:DUF4439 domain-containing protein n=1 Tax=Corynebacterium qintianiae TaxID=2709392 RepID=A0A7T0PD45_9CORY|nr:hypothetical protein [Corynebacterium qintianiae]QPK82573.1 hypothetical protein G7Y29_06700 [Corynebacterium qintianiae]